MTDQQQQLASLAVAAVFADPEFGKLAFKTRTLVDAATRESEHGLKSCVSCPSTDIVEGLNMCPDCFKHGWPHLAPGNNK